MSKNPETESEESGLVNWDKVRQYIAGTAVPAMVSLVLITAVVSMAPHRTSAKGKAMQINCINDMKQLALDMRRYASNNHGQFPYATNWCDALTPSAGSSKVFHCPSDNSGSRSSYAFNAGLSGLFQTNIEPTTVLFFESNNGWNDSGGPERMVTNRHDSVLICFADGSVWRMGKSGLKTLRWNP